MTVKEFSFIKNGDDPCVYKKCNGEHILFLMLYVVDILIIERDIASLQAVKAWLHGLFSMNDLGDASYILGMKIYRDRSWRMIGLSQSACIDKVLERFKMENA